MGVEQRAHDVRLHSLDLGQYLQGVKLYSLEVESYSSELVEPENLVDWGTGEENGRETVGKQFGFAGPPDQ